MALSENGDAIAVDADESTTRVGGSLWPLSALDSPPAKLTPVLLLARGRWIAAYPAGADPLPRPTPPPTPRAV